jgi:soluble cytochrome b562
MVKKEFDQSSIPAAPRIRRRREKRIRTATSDSLSKSNRSGSANAKSLQGILARIDLPLGEWFSREKVREQWERSRQFFWGWHLVWMSLLVVCTGLGGVALQWLLTMPPPIDCDTIAKTAPERDQLYCAREAAKSGEIEKLVAAIALVESWPPDHPLQNQGRQLVGEWSLALLDKARQQFLGGDLDGAMEIVAKIPEDNPESGFIAAEVNSWQGDWQEGKLIYDKAQQAIQGQAWQKAEDYTRDLLKVDNIYWKTEKYTQLKQQINLERQGWNKLLDARYIAGFQTAEDFVRAIDLVRQLNPSTHARKVGETEVAKWSRELLKIAKGLADEERYDRALALAKWVPADSEVYAESQDFIKLNTAKSLIQEDSQMGDKLGDRLFAFLEAKAVASEIEADSPLYAQAQENVSTWEQSLEDLVTLQLASAVSSLQQPLALKMAIDQASTIGKERPRRIHAQTLIAQWRQQMQAIEDRRHLAAARAIAASDNIEGFKAAIATARQVELGRPLRVEAQTEIAHWTNQIEKIEDRPILAKAENLAKAGKLEEAIAVAKQIESGRALYSDAQAQIDEWVAEVQIAQDRPILDRAKALAAEGRLGEAIDTAAQIGYGRALYYDAQSAIGQWSAQLDAIYAARQAEARRASYQEPAPAPVYREPAPAPVYREPAPAPVYREPAPVYQEPAPVYQEPAPVYQEPAPVYQEPAPVYQEPAPVYQEPAPVYQEPAPEPAPPAEESYNDAPLPIDGIE